MAYTDFVSNFPNPPASFRGKPFWSWNGRLEESELIRQIHVFRLMGMGGFFMHSRTGLATEYLGEEWFRLINACADEAERHGMEAWLYDEDRWPSGTAGGLVTAEPRFRMKYLRMETCEASDTVWTPDTVAVFVARVKDLACYDSRRVPHGQDVRPGAGEALLCFRVTTQRCSSTYNGYTYVNTMNAEATARFIELTHEQYARHCGTRLGRSIPGIFTDEPHRGALMDPFSEEGPVAAAQVPWTDDLPEQFQKAFGYDLLDHLPELFLQPNGERVSQVKWHFVELLMRLFLERFAKPYADWCRQHGIAVTGHVLHEDSLAAQTSMCGSVMRYYEYMDVPGIDLLSEGNRCFWVAKQLQSAAAQLGRPWLLSELYGCTGWQMPFKGHKAVGDWQALFGVNLRCHHLSWYTMEGEAKRDYPASIFHQSAWWPLYRFVEDYFSRLGLFLSQGNRDCRLLVIHPVESVWCQVHRGWAQFLNGQTAAIREAEQRFAELFHWLQGAQLDFDYADEAMLAAMGSVTHDGRIRVGRAEYDAVVVGGLLTIRSTTLELLRQALAAKGAVVFAGEPPAYVDAVPSSEAGAVAADAVRVEWERSAVVAACEQAAGRSIAVRHGATGRLAQEVYAHVRRDGEGRTYVMLLNTDRENPVLGLTVHIAVQGEVGSVEQWDCWTGSRCTIEHRRDGDWVVLETDLEAAGERTFVLQPGPSEAAPAVRRAVSREVVLNGPFRYRLSEPNVAVLDMCEFRVGDGEWHGPTEVLKADRAVRSAFGLEPRGGYMLQPWFAARQPRRVLGTVTVRFHFMVDVLPASPVYLAVERPDVFSVSVNGVAVPAPQQPDRWVDIAFARLPVPDGCLRVGLNTVELRCDYAADIGLEAVYLLGDFGVQVRGSQVRIVLLPDVLTVGDVTGQGLPFYGGAIAYELGLPAAVKDVPVRIASPGLSAACAVAVPSGTPLPDTSTLEITDCTADIRSDQVIAWDPWQATVPAEAVQAGRAELHVYLTRRNTFGPLHQVPLQAPSYGPWNWVTEGDHFSESYMLWPSGLLRPPRILIHEA